MELLERASPKKVSAAPPFLRRGRKNVLLPGSSALRIELLIAK
jgi:hypothetical protein